jgi:SAM-dependent methyltransferase
MTHDHKNGHGHHHHHHHHDHDHGHDHHHGDDDHHHHHHDHGLDHSHDWHSKEYVSHWIARDEKRGGERREILAALIAAAPFAPDAAIDVLDVGGGNGVVTGAIVEAFPNARVTLLDYSEEMLARARARFASCGRDVRYVRGDLLDPDWPRAVGGPFDLAVSAIAIHNLQNLAAMAACYEAVHGLLKRGGCFLDYDHFDKFGGVPLHQHSLRVAGFATVEPVWHKHPTAVLKAVT